MRKRRAKRRRSLIVRVVRARTKIFSLLEVGQAGGVEHQQLPALREMGIKTKVNSELKPLRERCWPTFTIYAMSTNTYSCHMHPCVSSQAVKSSTRWVQLTEQRWQQREDCIDLRRPMVKTGHKRLNTSDLMTQLSLQPSVNCQSTALSLGNTRQEPDKMQVMTLASKVCE